MELQIDSPRPVPFPSGALVKKGSKILSRSSWEIPTPVSVTRTNTSLAARWAKMFTVPPFGMAFIALSNRLMNTCSRRLFSAQLAVEPLGRGLYASRAEGAHRRVAQAPACARDDRRHV